MRTVGRATFPACVVSLLVLAVVHPPDVAAQARGERGDPSSSAQITLSAEVRGQIRDFYAGRDASAVEALPPGIRRRLERGRPLPPGIAKRTPPPELRSRVAIPEGYELVEVGVDVLLVDAATDIIHDVLMDIVR